MPLPIGSLHLPDSPIHFMPQYIHPPHTVDQMPVTRKGYRRFPYISISPQPTIPRFLRLERKFIFVCRGTCPITWQLFSMDTAYCKLTMWESNPHRRTLHSDVVNWLWATSLWCFSHVPYNGQPSLPQPFTIIVIPIVSST